jgi:hypothetical protein
MTDPYSITIDGETTSIGTAAELVVALNVLQGQHDRAVLEQLYSHLAEIIGGPQGLYITLNVLVPDDQLYLIDALGPRLAGAVQRAGALRDILATLADARVEERLLETLGADGLQALIGSAEDLAGVLEWVYGSSDQLVFQLLGAPFLKLLFQNGYELSLVLYSLDRARQLELVEMLGWSGGQSLVHNLRDLAHLLRALPGEHSTRLLTRFTKDQLWGLVRNDHGLDYLGKYLEAEEAACLNKLLEEDNAE